jgi:hypothetical protein
LQAINGLLRMELQGWRVMAAAGNSSAGTQTKKAGKDRPFSN